MIKSCPGKGEEDPKRSARQIAKGTNASLTSMRRIIKNDLKLLPYKMRRRQYLTPVQNQNIFDRAKILEGWHGRARTRFYLMKKSSQLKLLLTIRMTECT